MRKKEGRRGDLSNGDQHLKVMNSHNSACSSPISSNPIIFMLDIDVKEEKKKVRLPSSRYLSISIESIIITGRACVYVNEGRKIFKQKPL